jgi:hypothetical protein
MNQDHAYHILATGLYQSRARLNGALKERDSAQVQVEFIARDVAALETALRSLGHDLAQALSYGETESL